MRARRFAVAAGVVLLATAGTFGGIAAGSDGRPIQDIFAGWGLTSSYGDATGTSAERKGNGNVITISGDPFVVQARVKGDCAVGSAIRSIAADGSVTCGAHGWSWRSTADRDSFQIPGRAVIATTCGGTRPTVRLTKIPPSLLPTVVSTGGLKPTSDGFELEAPGSQTILIGDSASMVSLTVISTWQDGACTVTAFADAT